MQLNAVITWHPISEPPPGDEPFSGLLAFADDLGEQVLEDGIFVWIDGQWLSECTGLPNDTADWWMAESELVAALNQSTRDATAMMEEAVTHSHPRSPT